MRKNYVISIEWNFYKILFNLFSLTVKDIINFNILPLNFDGYV